MKRLFVCLGIAVALTGADRLLAGPERLEPKDYKAAPQPIVEPMCRWTGFYIGAHGGYAWGGGSSFLELDESDPAYEFDRDGFIGGGQAGFNLQLGRFFVIGIEGTFSGGDLSGDTKIEPEPGDVKKGQLDSNWIATVAGRAGISFCRNHMLAYLKGGAAFSDYDFDTEEVGDNGKFHADDNETFGLVGFGLEYAFNCHWSVRAEYNHLFAEGDNNVTGTEKDGGNREERTFHVNRDDVDLVTAGLNFKF